LEKNYKDFGPVLDCIVWNDGTEWRVCLSQDGDLANGIILGEFKLRQEFQPLTKEDQMNISVNVYDGGNTLEIVGMCGTSPIKYIYFKLRQFVGWFFIWIFYR